MTTIVIDQVQLQLTPQQLAKALRQLSPNELESVLRELEQPWAQRFDALLTRVRQRALQSPMSDAEIESEVDQARAEHYARRS